MSVSALGSVSSSCHLPSETAASKEFEDSSSVSDSESCSHRAASSGAAESWSFVVPSVCSPWFSLGASADRLRRMSRTNSLAMSVQLINTHDVKERLTIIMLFLRSDEAVFHLVTNPSEGLGRNVPAFTLLRVIFSSE